MNAELRDLLPLYAIGALIPQEEARVEEHLRTCGECQGELRELRELSVDLAGLSAEAPPAELKARVLSKIGEAPRQRGVILDQGGIFLSRSEELPWRQVLPGVETKILNLDRAGRYVTSLVRVAPGAAYPRHHHFDVEELYILSGDISIERTVARAGDYCRAEPDSIHMESRSVNGCLFLAVASARDEILA